MTGFAKSLAGRFDSGEGLVECTSGQPCTNRDLTRLKNAANKKPGQAINLSGFVHVAFLSISQNGCAYLSQERFSRATSKPVAASI